MIRNGRLLCFGLHLLDLISAISASLMKQCVCLRRAKHGFTCVPYSVLDDLHPKPIDGLYCEKGPWIFRAHLLCSPPNQSSHHFVIRIPGRLGGSRLSRRLPPPGRAATDSDPRRTQSDSGARSGPGPGVWIRAGGNRDVETRTIHRPRVGGHGHTVPVRRRVTGNASQAVRVRVRRRGGTRCWRRVTAGDSCR
jgi:hypothetical protein